MSYQDTLLWKRTLGSDDKNVEHLRESYLRARENAEFLLGKIRNDFPNLTVHDITHVDSLWNVADTIIGPNYPINPLEGYVLGIAFLIHDATLSYETFGGQKALRETIEWKDAYAEGPSDSNNIEAFEKNCDFAAIRTLHAQNAESILEKLFIRENNTSFYIIDDNTYRNHYGDLIGRIAASHHWDMDKVELEFKDEAQINPLAEFPGNWTINALKLACILRCADAGHIDNGRAPDCIYHSLVVNGVSRDHWEAQNHLGQVTEDSDNPRLLRITSTNRYKKSDFSAWNVAYEAVKLFDDELKKSNDLLRRNTFEEFPHKGVSGANSKESLARFVKTKGWNPCNFGVHTSNVKALIENLGGRKLYGSENLLLITMRELIQNARDAIHARRGIDNYFNYGKITIRITTSGSNHSIVVEDNGIGMSLDCIKHHLLNFGSSYWKSLLSQVENPGLRSSGFTSVGKFGIGFYAVFMVASSGVVQTKRFNRGNNDSVQVEFPEGLTLSPILSDCELAQNVSTIIKFNLKKEISLDCQNIVDDSADDDAATVNLNKMLPILVTGLDSDVYLEDVCIHKSITSGDFNKKEWLEGLYPDCSENLDIDFADNLDLIKDDRGRIRGIIDIYRGNSRFFYPSIETVGGLWSISNHSDHGFIGYIDGIEIDVSRNYIFLDENLKSSLHKWFVHKYELDYNQIIDSSEFAEKYCNFCKFIELKPNERAQIINNNINKVFDYFSFRDKKSSVNRFSYIHNLLFAGLSPHAGRIKKESFHGHTIRERLEEILELQLAPRDREEIYNNIIMLFLRVALLKPFSTDNELFVSIWINLVLNQYLNQMIDWRDVDYEKFKEHLNIFKSFQNYSSSFPPMSEFLKQYIKTSSLEVLSSHMTIAIE